jgi:type IV pilus assembly protein PilE
MSGGGSLERNRGFTLIELAFTLTIVGILASIAQPSFREYAMRARRTEAKTGLESIHLAQTAMFGDAYAYGDTFDEIGAPLQGGVSIDAQTLRANTYTFTVRALPLDDNPRGNFQAIATADLDPGDGVFDILMIENVLTVLP